MKGKGKTEEGKEGPETSDCKIQGEEGMWAK